MSSQHHNVTDGHRSAFHMHLAVVSRNRHMLAESGSRMFCGGSDLRRLENMATNRWRTQAVSPDTVCIVTVSRTLAVINWLITWVDFCDACKELPWRSHNTCILPRYLSLITIFDAGVRSANNIRQWLGGQTKTRGGAKTIHAPFDTYTRASTFQCLRVYMFR
jgi:hypothetical protein